MSFVDHTTISACLLTRPSSQLAHILSIDFLFCSFFFVLVLTNIRKKKEEEEKDKQMVEFITTHLRRYYDNDHQLVTM
jgi:hypothetical protein